VQALHYDWQTRVATSSIPPETLDKMLRRLIDPNDPNARIQLAAFYIQGQYYREARKELESIREQFGERFPELSKNVDARLVELRQSQAREVVAEIQLRSRAGQHRRAVALLQKFPQEDVAAPILQQVSDLLDDYKERLAQTREAADLLRTTLRSVPQGELRAAAEPLVEQIANQLNIENVARLEGFVKLGRDLQPQEALALALTGWLMGGDAAETELPLGLSLWHARELVLEYLREEQFVRRKDLLDRLGSIEGISPERVAKIITQLPPPLAPAQIEPAQTQHLRVTQGPLSFEYDVWLPPDYFTDVRYPAVITLHGAGSTCEMQVDWWSTQAGRHGYIVIAPAYAKAGQTGYEFSAEEHAVVIATMRDALKRFQIDSDRVFLSGHSMGAMAAWDIGLSHPHLFAGVIPISGYPDKYSRFYDENAQHLPFYVVAGQLDGITPAKIATELDRGWMSHNDVRYVEYIGRGHEHFREEIHRLFDWMQRRRRVAFPTDFTCITLRRSDDRFYWVQLDSIPANVALPPPLFGKKDPDPMHVQGHISAKGAVNVRGAGSSDLTIWLAPELVDFNQRIQLRVNSRTRHSGFLEPNLQDMLEDVRVRGDRQRFYWKKFELAAGR
jgi:pimeloyl-ACP methyl ester carboxylesterase